MERVKQYFIARGSQELADRIMLMPESGATVDLCATVLQCEPGAIAKAICLIVKHPEKIRYDAVAPTPASLVAEAGANAGPFTPTSAVSPVSRASPVSLGGEQGTTDLPVLIVCAGDTKLNQTKFKKVFANPPKMVKKEDCEEASGHPAGAVCPFAVGKRTQVFLDVSLTRFERLFPATGSHDSGIWLTPQELVDYGDHVMGWVDVCERVASKPETGEVKD